MATGARARPSIIGWASATGIIGVLCSLGPLGLTVAGSLVLSLLICVLPFPGFLFALASKPIVDCFWFQSLGDVGGSRVNLQSVVGIFVPVAIAISIQRASRWPHLRGVWAYACGYGLLAAVGIALSPYRGGAVADFMRIALPLVFIAFGTWIGSDSKRLDSIAAILCIYGMIPATIALLELTGIISAKAGGIADLDATVRARGFYQHPLDIAMRCGIAFPFALFIGRTNPSRFVRACVNGIASLLAVVAMATLVRSAIVATFSQLLAWGWTGRRRALTLIGVALGVVIALNVAPVQRVVRGAIDPLKEGAGYRFASGRFLLFATQIAGFKDASVGQKLLGRGLHTTPSVTLKYSPLSEINPAAADYEEGKVTAHNQLLRVLTESGLLGVGTFIALIVSSFWVLSGRDRQRGTDRALFARATLAALVGACVYSLSATPFDQPSVTWPLWFAVGVVAAPVDSKGIDAGGATKVPSN
jgi:hypothetical protein